MDIANWPKDQDFPIMPFGAREKSVYICPDPSPHEFLLPGHRYLFKLSNPRAPHQFWSEVIAYRIGCLMDVAVPPAFVAVDSRSSSCGALIEFFYKYWAPAEPTEFTHGGDYCVQHKPDFERTRGSSHTVELIFDIAAAERGKGLADDPIQVWGPYFLFDAIIGNQDRHQDNWGLIWEIDRNSGARRGMYAPAFDNGTSLGYEFPEGSLPNTQDPRWLERYLTKGRHHVRKAGDFNYQPLELIFVQIIRKLISLK